MYKYDKIKINRLWNGKVSIRDYVVSKAISKGHGIEVECKGAVMKLKPVDLITKGKVASEKFKSKFGDKEYKLIDFDWKNNGKD